MAEVQFTLLLLCLCFYGVHSATECFKNEELGQADGNVYHCYSDTPECCVDDTTTDEDKHFTCCESTSKKSLREQLQLWGTVAGLAALMLLVCCCLKTDGICNGGDETPSLLDRIRGIKTKPALTDLSKVDNPGAGKKGDNLDYYRKLPPLPPVTPMPDKNHYDYPAHDNAGYDGDTQYR